MKITFYGHSTFGIEISGKLIIIDPFISGNPLASHIDINALQPDYILISHAHQDHVLDVEWLAKQSDALIISNFEIVSHYESKGFKGMSLNHGGTVGFDRFSVKYVKAVHSSSFADGTYGGEPGGFVISSKEKSLYYAGDTALTYDMKLIPLYAALDAVILPVGDIFTMGYEDAAMASDFVECPKVIGCHFNTFPPIQIDTEIAKDYFSALNKELVLLEIGTCLEI